MQQSAALSLDDAVEQACGFVAAVGSELVARSALWS
jgi:hypothetical protein